MWRDVMEGMNAPDVEDRCSDSARVSLTPAGTTPACLHTATSSFKLRVCDPLPSVSVMKRFMRTTMLRMSDLDWLRMTAVMRAVSPAAYAALSKCASTSTRPRGMQHSSITEPAPCAWAGEARLQSKAALTTSSVTAFKSRLNTPPHSNSAFSVYTTEAMVS